VHVLRTPESAQARLARLLQEPAHEHHHLRQRVPSAEPQGAARPRAATTSACRSSTSCAMSASVHPEPLPLRAVQLGDEAQDLAAVAQELRARAPPSRP
jgi:hypothetical protein